MPRGDRHRARNPDADPVPHLRAIFYDQRGGQRNWARAQHRLRDRSAPWRHDRDRQSSRARHVGPGAASDWRRMTRRSDIVWGIVVALWMVLVAGGLVTLQRYK